MCLYLTLSFILNLNITNVCLKILLKTLTPLLWTELCVLSTFPVDYYVEVLNPSVTVFGEGTWETLIKVKLRSLPVTEALPAIGLVLLLGAEDMSELSASFLRTRREAGNVHTGKMAVFWTELADTLFLDFLASRTEI